MPKVLVIGYGSFSRQKGGSIACQEALLEAVNRCGWEATYLFTAPYYDIRKNPYLKKWYNNKVKFIGLYNSPLVALSQDSPEKQCHELQTQNLVKEVLDEEKPDLVHFHELQMFPVSIIDLAVERNIPCIKTMHNYYDICPERDLMYKGESLCLDFDEGRRCVECLTIFPSSQVSFKRRITRTLLPDFLYNILSKFLIKIKKTPKGKNKRNQKQQDNKNAAYNAGRYRRRRDFFIERLNKLDAVHFSSHRLTQIFVNYGLSEEKARIIPHSSKTIEDITAKPLRDNHYPVVFGFLGGTWLHKGYQVLFDAFSGVDQNKAKLIISGGGKTPNLNQNLNIELRGPFKAPDLNRLLQEIDVGIVPSVWEEAFGIVGIEFLAAKIPVIASNIGGIPEWLKDKENGFLVEPNNVKQLAEKMELFIKNPQLISEIQRKIKPWKSFEQYAGEIISLYEEVIHSNKQ